MTGDAGWPWQADGAGAASDADTGTGDGGQSLAIAFARCFATPEGRRVLQQLRAWTLERAVGPAASDAQLRHLEGQRQLVAQVLMLIREGGGGPSGPHPFSPRNLDLQGD